MSKWILTGLILCYCSNSNASNIGKELLLCSGQYKNDNVARLECFDKILAEPGENLHKDPAPASPRVDEYHDGKYFLTSNNPNYLVWASPYEDKLFDDAHLEFYISTKYPLFLKKNDAAQVDSKKPENRFSWFRTPERFFLVYNGLYDFYVSGDRYDSKPIISRLQNIGLIGEWHAKTPNTKIRVGWMHESNGQVIGEDEAHVFNARRAEFGDDFAFSGVSRGWDLLQLRYEKSSWPTLQDYGAGWWRYQFELRSYICNCQGFVFDKEDDIWWESGNSASIAKFDGLRFRGEKVYTINGNDILLRAELKTGIRDLTNFGGKISLGYKLGNARATLFYFNGFGKEPSTYHLRTKYAGFGLELR